MKIAIPQNGQMLNQHFGQSKSFLIATIEDDQITDRHEISTDALQHNHAGLSSLFKSQGVSLVITGGIGSPALIALQSQGLQVIRGANGAVEDVLQGYLSGRIQDQNVTCSEHKGEHHHNK